MTQTLDGTTVVGFNPIVIKGDKGDKGDAGGVGPAGPANTLTIGTVTTGIPGTPAQAQITGVGPNQTLNLTIPKGFQGDQGVPGGVTKVSGFTPDVTGNVDLSGIYARVVNGVLVSKVKTDGTDQTATVNSELAALYAAGRGAVH